MVDLEGIIHACNPGVERMTGFTADELTGGNFSQLYLPEDQALAVPQHEMRMASQIGRFLTEGRRYRKGGGHFQASVTIRAIYAPDGEVAGFLTTVRDLTETSAEEQSLRKNEKDLRLMVDTIKDYAIFLMDAQGHIMTWNSGACHIKQYAEHEIIGAHFSIFYPQEARAIGLPATLLADAVAQGSAEDEGWRLRKDGSRFWANVTITALFDEQHELRGFSKITRDLTGQRQIEALRECGRRKNAFLATLAHELRNPLAPILTAVEIIQRSPHDPTVVSRLGEVLKTQVGQMTHLLDDLLDMARVISGKIILQRSEVPLSEVIESSVQAIRPALDERGHQFKCDVPPQPVIIPGDFHRLVQLLTNVLSNAVSFTPPNGIICLQASLGANGEELEIRVIDNGIGIPVVLQHSVFEMFDQGASGAADGLGMGLTLVKTLTELHGGSVSLLSEGDGSGCVFTIRLPLHPSSFGPKEENIHVLAALEPPVRVLVADDSKNAADVLGMFLRMEGFEVAIAYDGQEAVEVAADFSPQLAFLDLGMPRLGGLAAGRAIRTLFPGIKIAALSGWGAADDQRQTAEAGFDLHLVKPSKPDDIRRALDVMQLASGR